MDRYGDLKLKLHESIFSVNDRAEMKKAKIMLIAISDFKNNSKSLFCSNVVMLAGADLDCMQSSEWLLKFIGKRNRTR